MDAKSNRKFKSILAVTLLAALISGILGQSLAETVGADNRYYYNSKGGKYYHSDPECKIIDSQWFPLAPLSLLELSNPTYAYLLPCYFCVSSGEINNDTESNISLYVDSMKANDENEDQIAFAGERVKKVKPTNDAIAIEDALKVAREKVGDLLVLENEYVANLPYKATYLSIEIDGVSTDVWVVCFFPDQPSAFVLAVTLRASSGEIIHAEANRFQDISETWTSWGFNDYFLWSAEEKAVFHAIYQEIPTRIMPGANALPQTEALQIAMNEIQRKEGLSEKELAFYQVDYNYVPNWYVQQNDDAWLIMFRPVTGIGSMYQIVLSAKDGSIFTYDRNDEAYPSR